MHKIVSENIRNRRSIFPKNYTTEVVSNQIIEEMLENANWAPTHKFTEPWRFSVFTAEGLNVFAEKMAHHYKAYAEKTGEFDQKKYEKFLTKPLLASHIISLGVQRHASIPAFEETCAVACAAQNMMLTASSRGIGCYWTTGGFQFYEQFKSFLGLGEEDQLLGFLYVGIPDQNMKEPRGFRKPISDKVKWIK